MYRKHDPKLVVINKFDKTLKNIETCSSRDTRIMKGKKVTMNRRNAETDPEEDFFKTKDSKNMNMMLATPKLRSIMKTMIGLL